MSDDKLILRVNLDQKFNLEFHGVKVTSDAGLLAYREIDAAFGLTDMAACGLKYNRTGRNTQHSITALLRQSVYSRLADLLNTKAVKFWAQVGIGRFSKLEEPFFVQIIGKMPGRMSFLDSETGF